MNKVIIPTGYMGSGSSAITDLFQEFEEFASPNGSNEYVFMHCPNGLFDLEDKLLIGNNAIRSDEAIRSFEKMMSELNGNAIWWVGRYKWTLSKDFMNHVDSFIEDITFSKSNSYWYYQEDRRIRALPLLALRSIWQRLHFPGKPPAVPKLYNGMVLSLPSPDEFYDSAQRFIGKVFDDLGRTQTNLIMDQMILPFNAWRFDNYFDDDVECFIVDRDPRDVFLSNKHYWKAQGVPVPYSTDAKEFCHHYRRLREMEKFTDSKHVHRIHFEDLIYKYEETVIKIYSLINLDPQLHTRKNKIFIPEESINNTQLFLKEQYKEDAALIEDLLPDYLYEFPYARL